MSIFDAFDLFDLLDVLVYWRFFVATAIGICLALGIYTLFGETPAAAAVSFGIGLAGVCVGLVWQYRRA